ncbi:hypothetical protein [Planctopirus hydrillae]|uniref:hypothetical protein n=1 Tax=Planctopirus hydrillae TaxID=1841610 RepID=UPI00197C973E
MGECKAHFQTQTGYGGSTPERHEPELLFQLGRDPSEKRIVAAHPEVLARIQEAIKAHQSKVIPGPPQL